MGSVFTCKLNPCCGDRYNCEPPRQYSDPEPALAPVAPSGAEPVAAPFGLNEDGIETLRSNGLKPEEIAADPVTQAERVRELLHWFVRLSHGSANPKWTRDHAFELAYYIATTDDRAPIDTHEIEKGAWLKGVKATHVERDQMLRLGFITKAEFDAAIPARAVPAEDIASLVARLNTDADRLKLSKRADLHAICGDVREASAALTSLSAELAQRKAMSKGLATDAASVLEKAHARTTASEAEATDLRMKLEEHRTALEEVRGHFLVDYSQTGGRPAVTYDMDALPKVIALLDRTLSGASE